MQATTARSGGSSAADMSDLDGFSVPGDYSFSLQTQFGPAPSDDFGFDPPMPGTVYPKLEAYSPSDQIDPLQLSSWPSMSNTSPVQPSKLSLPNNDMAFQEMDRLISQSLPDASTAISRYGQVTPPRSNSAVSEDKSVQSPKSTAPERRKRSSKASIKEEPTSNVLVPGRKRKNSRKVVAVNEEQDDKRRQSLEKNRLAAAKCRVNKKEKTEQLQRDSHDKAVHNAFLKDQVMRMKEEVQQMNALLLQHANCEGCKSPEEISKHLHELGNDFFTHHMPSMSFGDYAEMALPPTDMHHDYFDQNASDAGMLNPPLPDFDRAAEFEVHTPMQTD